MSKYPGATWRPLKENANAPEITPTQLIFHSAVSNGDSIFDYFNRSDVVVESHFYVQNDGDTEQYIDTNHQADANYRANRRAISVESWDEGHPDEVPWNDDQLNRLADIAAWAHREHGIPLVRAPAATEPGIGGHTDYPSWTNVKGKTCPGLARRGQVDTIISMALDLVGREPDPDPVLEPETGDALVMDQTAKNEIRKIIQEELHTVLGNANSGTDADKTHDSLADVRRDLKEILARIKALPK